MNILPKKSWHVRNKDNVARVRRDEAKALEEEREVAKRKAIAEQEARIRVLRDKAKAIKSDKIEGQWDLPQEPAEECDNELEDKPGEDAYRPLNTAFPLDKHINLFEDFEHNKKSQGANRDYEKEKKKAQEDYEKKIGYLTYLGQSASEFSAEKPWYERISRSGKSDKKDEDIVRATYSQQEAMSAADPLRSMKGYLDKKKRAEDVFYGRTKEVSLDVTNRVRGGRKRFNDQSASSHSFNDSKVTDLKVTEPKVAEPKVTDTTQHKHKKNSHKKKKKKHKKSRHSSPDASPQPEKPTIEALRAARLEREAGERHRSIDLVSRLQRGLSTPAHSVIDERSLRYNTVYMARR